MGWIQLCGLVWGLGAGVGIGRAARCGADRFAAPQTTAAGWCESIGGVLFAGIGWWGADNQVTAEALGSMVALAFLIGWSIALGATDVAVRRLPNVLTAVGFSAAVVHGIVIGSVMTPIAGAVLLAAPYLAAFLCAPGSVGTGDVKLAFGTGGVAAFGGAECWLAAAVAAPVITAFVGIGLAVFRSRPVSSSLPHGASMCLATVSAVLAVAV